MPRHTLSASDSCQLLNVTICIGNCPFLARLLLALPPCQRATRQSNCCTHIILATWLSIQRITKEDEERVTFESRAGCWTSRESRWWTWVSHSLVQSLHYNYNLHLLWAILTRIIYHPLFDPARPRSSFPSRPHHPDVKLDSIVMPSSLWLHHNVMFVPKSCNIVSI